MNDENCADVRAELAAAEKALARAEAKIYAAIEYCRTLHAEATEEMPGAPKGRYAYLKAQMETSRDVARVLGASLTLDDGARCATNKFRGFRGFK